MKSSFTLFKLRLNLFYFVIINLTLFILILCNDIPLPNQITTDYFELNSLNSGSRLELKNGKNNDYICFYDYYFSKAINNGKNIICLEQYQFIYIFNNKDEYSLYCDLDDLKKNGGTHFSLIPYTFENDSYFIITYVDAENKLNLTQYQINIINSTCQKVKSNKIKAEVISTFQNHLNCTVSQNSSVFLICFFMENQWIYSFTFDIEKNFTNINITNITCEDCLDTGYYTLESSSISTNGNDILICYLYTKMKSHCYFYNINNYYFNKNYSIKDCQDYMKVAYFIETKEFTVICKTEGKKIKFYKLNDENNLEQNFEKDAADFGCTKSVINFFLNYDIYKEEYNLINDCYHNHTFINILSIHQNMSKDYIPQIYYNISDITYNISYINSTEKPTTNLIEYNIININEKRNIEEILSNLTDFFKDKEVGLNYEIKTGNCIISLRPTNSMAIIPSKTHLNLSQCESILRRDYDLNLSIITLFQLEISDTNSESLINKVEYKLYDENFKELDLNKCKNSNINIEVIYGIKKDITIDYDKVISYQNLGVNIFNLSDIFFNDICQIYSDFEKDIILEDRIKDIFLNYSICEEGCTYKSFDGNYYTFKCECNIKNSINTEIIDIKLGSFDRSSNNFEVFKCINLVFSPDDKINNIGFWIFTFVLGGHVPLLFHYINTGIKPIEDYIISEMTEFGYIKDDKNNKKKTNVKNKKNKKGMKGKKKRKISKKKKKDEDIKEKKEDKEEYKDKDNGKEEEEKKEENEEKDIKNDENNNDKQEKLNNIEEKDINIVDKENNEDNKDNDRNDNNENEQKDNDEKCNSTASPPIKNVKNKNINKIDSPKNDKKIKTNLIKKNNLKINYDETENPESLDINKNKRKRKKLIKNNKDDKNTKLNSKKGNKSKKLSKKILHLDKISDGSNNNLKNSNKSLDSNFIQIQDFEFELYKDEEKEDVNEKIGINLININLTKKNKKKIIPKDSDKILNNYSFDEAIEYDRRSFCKIFYIFLLAKQVIFHTFLYKSPLELISIRILVLIFIFSTDLLLNAFFYFNSFISKKYRYSKGLFFFTFTNTISIIFLSIIIGFIFLIAITKLSNSTYAIRDIFKKEEDKIKSDNNYKTTEQRKAEIKKEIDEILKKIKIKNIVLFIVEFVVMLFYWYFITAFCHVYTNTQVSWILDSFLTIIISFFIECLFWLLFAELYRISVDNKAKSIYTFIMFLYNFV